MAERFARINGASPELDRAQRRIQDGYSRGNPPFAGEGAQRKLRITDTRTVTIAHKLGRKPQGYKELSRTGDGVGTLVLKNATAKQVEFELKVPAGAPATSHEYDLWFF